MTNTERIQANNAELLECIEIAESLPDVSGGDLPAPTLEWASITLGPNATYDMTGLWKPSVSSSWEFVEGDTWVKYSSKGLTWNNGNFAVLKNTPIILWHSMMVMTGCEDFVCLNNTPIEKAFVNELGYSTTKYGYVGYFTQDTILW